MNRGQKSPSGATNLAQIVSQPSELCLSTVTTYSLVSTTLLKI